MKVIILDEGFIPGLGRGPFLDPTEISSDKYQLYKRMGLQIVDVSAKIPMAESGVINRTSKPKIKTTIKTDDVVIKTSFDNDNKEEEIKETTVEEVKIETATTVDSEETEEEENIIEETSEAETATTVDSEETEEEETTEDELTVEDIEAMTKKEIISLLEENEVEVDGKLNKTELVNLAVESLL